MPSGDAHRNKLNAAPPTLPWTDFAKLRLRQFLPRSGIRLLRNWEYMGHLWIGEAAGFTEWLRRKDDPDVLRSMTLDVSALDGPVVDAVLARVGLPLRPERVTRSALERALGAPASVGVFPRATDRETLVYPPLAPGGYRLSFTVQKRVGLAYLGIMRGDWERRRRSGSK